MMATIDGRPRATHSAYTSAASSTAIRIPITSSPFSRRTDGTPMLPTSTTDQSDLSIAVAAAQAAFAAADAARDAPAARPRQGRQRRPRHRRRRQGRGGRGRGPARAPPRRRDHRRGGHRRRAATGARRWYVDGIDGTVAFAAGMPGAGAAPSCSRTSTARRRPPSTTGERAATPPRAARARTLNGEPLRVRDAAATLDRGPRRHVPAPGPARPARRARDRPRACSTAPA